MSIKVTVDRMENNTAILLVRPDEMVRINFPLFLLPDECLEGDILEIDINIDKKKTEDAKQDTLKLIEKLKN